MHTASEITPAGEREFRAVELVELGTHVLMSGVARCGVERCCIGVSTDRHAVLHVGRIRLRDDVERPCSVFVFVFVRGPGGVVGGRRGRLSSSERGLLLEDCEGRVEGTAERLGEGANVFGGGDNTECGHGWKLDRDS